MVCGVDNSAPDLPSCTRSPEFWRGFLMMIREPSPAAASAAAKFARLPVHQKGELQKILIDMLASVLKVKPAEIDIAKNFDEYGLDSIDAVIATEWVGKKVGVTLPPEFLLIFRSIDAVTNALLTGEYRRVSSPSRPPFFLFPGAGGIDEPALIRFREQAASRLTFEVVPTDTWHHWIDRRYNFEDLATQAAQYVNANSPQGPIRLAGYSQGGQLAYVTALALKNMGRNVELVCMIDTETNGINVRAASNDSILMGAIKLCRKYIAGRPRGRALFPPG